MEANQEIPVVIAIHTSSRDESGAPDEKMRMLAHGVLIPQQDGAHLLRYTETITDEDSGATMSTEVRLKIEAARVLMHRKGTFSTTMVFSRGQRFEGTYRTPYGEMAMAVYTTRLVTALQADRGRIALEYQLDMNGGFSSMRKMTIEFGAEELMPS